MRAWLIMVLLVTTAHASDLNMAVVAAPPAAEGHSRVQVAVHNTRVSRALSRGAPFKVVVGGGPSSGEATVSNAQTVAQAGERVHTVLAFDQSGSFRKWWEPSFDLAEAFAERLPADGSHEVQVVTFGVQLDEHGKASKTKDLKRLLTVAEAQGATQGFTRLRNFTRDATGLAEAALPVAKGGLRQVIVFTDAGEESAAYDIQEVVDHARDLNVRVHVVAFSKGSGASDTFARRLDEVKQIAESTGGRFIQVVEGANLTSEVAELAVAATRVYWLDLDWCGVGDAGGTHLTDELLVEVWNDNGRLASSSAFPFRQHASGAALEPCRPENIAENTDNKPKKTGFFWWLAGGGLGLLGLLGLALVLLALWLMFRKKRDGEEGPTTAPEPTPELDGDGVFGVWQDPFVQLPETHLIKVTGPNDVPARVRIHRTEIWIGGSTEADVTIDVPQISGRHVRIQLYEAGTLYVTDEGSTNGTWVEGHRLAPGERREVQVGQHISVSRQVVFRVEQPRGEAPNGARSAVPSVVATPVKGGPDPRAPKKTIYAPVRSPKGDDEES